MHSIFLHILIVIRFTYHAVGREQTKFWENLGGGVAAALELRQV